MPTYARFFIRNSGAFMDAALPPNMNLPTLMRAVKGDGQMSMEDFFIPYDNIHYVATYNASQPQQPNNVLKLVPDPDKPL